MLGGLVGMAPKETSHSLSSLSAQSLQVPDYLKPVYDAAIGIEQITFDSYQTASNLTIVIYTKWKQMRQEYLIVNQVALKEETNYGIFCN